MKLMDNDWFFEKFEVIAELPDAVTRMRELVLELAVQGRFSQPICLDSPEQIEASRNGINSKFPAKNLQLHSRWDSVALKSILSELRNGYSGKTKKSHGFFKITRIETIADGTFDFERVGFADDIPEAVIKKHRIRHGDILFSHINSEPHLGKTAIYTGKPGELIHGVNLLLLRTDSKVDAFYLNIVLRRMRTSGYFKAIAKRAINQASINQKNLGETPIPLPPLSEQRHIVSKVEELMGICDALEAQQQEREERKVRLVKGSLKRFSETPSVENLGYLFHGSYAVSPSDLRKTILTLAVQGKLVPQDPAEGTAGTNLTKGPFLLPSSWAWKRLESIGICRTGKTPSTAETANYGKGFPFIGPGQITIRGEILEPEKTITKQGLDNTTEGFPGDILMVCIGGSIGKVAICRNTIGFNQQINSFRPSEVSSRYVYIAMSASYFQASVITNSTGSATPIINKGKWEQLLIPIPPLPEQRRIVARVEELMLMVDELERLESQTRHRGASLLDAIVHRLSASAG
ncbi:MAG: restriction endonuclease subunit S [Planctomycetaceae bacterium]|jgi:type I restriction enzyme S subunit|nr:restriction endonuclease subunit S [Planctomycetaceae bacterium]